MQHFNFTNHHHIEAETLEQTLQISPREDWQLLSDLFTKFNIAGHLLDLDGSLLDYVMLEN